MPLEFPRLWPDKSRHIPTPPAWTLTPQQETAVDLLASGQTVTDTAMAVEVTWQTVSEWRHHYPGVHW